VTKNKRRSLNILVLGSGMVGSVIAADLSLHHQVTSADADEKKLKLLSKSHNLKTIQLDILNKKDLEKIISPFDLVVNAVPGFMGYETLKNIISTGKDVVDISFFPEDAFTLHEFASQNNVTAIVDCGVAPGLSNIVLGYHYGKEKVKSFECYVGGLPFERKHPFQYKAPFSPADVIEEYTRPARIKENNIIKIKQALSEAELIDFQKVGTLEAFNSDGLRSLLHTIDIPDMKEKTLRYPGHIDAVKLLRDSGFFSTENLIINGSGIKPLDVSSKLLFNQWYLSPEDDEFTIMKILIQSEDITTTYNLFDRKDWETGFSSMARTTGFTCTAAVNLIAEGKFSRKGICPPEYIGMNEDNFRFILDYLKERNVNLEVS
jgi:lysine 6-dehydrogenase